MKTAGHSNYYKTEQCSEGALDCFHSAIHRRNPLATTSWPTFILSHEDDMHISCPFNLVQTFTLSFAQVADRAARERERVKQSIQQSKRFGRGVDLYNKVRGRCRVRRGRPTTKYNCWRASNDERNKTIRIHVYIYFINVKYDHVYVLFLSLKYFLKRF